MVAEKAADMIKEDWTKIKQLQKRNSQKTTQKQRN